MIFTTNPLLKKEKKVKKILSSLFLFGYLLAQNTHAFTAEDPKKVLKYEQLSPADKEYFNTTSKKVVKRVAGLQEVQIKETLLYSKKLRHIQKKKLKAYLEEGIHDIKTLNTLNNREIRPVDFNFFNPKRKNAYKLLLSDTKILFANQFHKRFTVEEIILFSKYLCPKNKNQHTIY